MKDKRQGNDLKVAWSIFMQDGEPFRLEGKDVSLYLKNMFGRKELNDFVTTGNIIQWTFYGKDQKNSGKYSLELVINEGEKGMITTDKCDFVNLVSCSCKLQGGEDAPNVETESIELTSTLEYVAGGMSEEEVLNLLDGKVDKEEGKGLSTNDYTDEEKQKLAGLENYDDSGIKEDLAKKADKSEIPTKMSQLEQDIEIGGTPDWDASEGEEGYINNKPFGKEFIDEGYFEEEGQTSVYFDDLINVSIVIEGERYSDLDIGDFTNGAWPVELEFDKNDGHRLVYTGSGGKDERFGYEISKLIQLDDIFIPDTIARKSELTELSAEVSGLSEKIENLPSGESSVFKAIYGETTIEEVTEAYNAGKVIHCDFQDRCYVLSRFNNEVATFSSVAGFLIFILELSATGWKLNNNSAENSANRVTKIDANSKDHQYPSAKAVYEALQNVGGGSDVFVAEYGETTYDEIVEARNAGKMVICVYNQLIYILIRLTAERANFSVTEGNFLYQVICPKGGSWLRDNVNLSHKLEVLADNKVKVTIGDNSSEVATPQYVDNAIQQSGGGGGASSDKQGVIRQTQKWTQAADKGYDYVMQNIVRGAIPQANIDLFTSAGATFNEESGYFELNGLTDISYEEMSAIYNAGFKMVEGYWMNNIRTNIFRPCNVYNAGDAQLYGLTGMYANRNCMAESFKFTEQEIYGVALRTQLYGTYEGCIYLKTFGKGVFFCHDSNIFDQAFGKCYSLETIYLRNLKKNVWFKDSARLSIASVLYMVANSAATSAIVITLHADAYARAMADTEIQSALEAHPNVSLASA